MEWTLILISADSTPQSWVLPQVCVVSYTDTFNTDFEISLSTMYPITIEPTLECLLRVTRQKMINVI